jgi:protein phosphatase
LSGPVRDEEIGVIAGNLPPAEACQALVDLANLRGGPDNISVVIVRSPYVAAVRSSGRSPNAAHKRPMVRPLFWQSLLSALVFVLGASLWSAGKDRIALEVFLVGAAIVALSGAFSVWQQRRREAQQSNRGRPHQRQYPSCRCELTPSIIRQLAALATHLQEVAREEDWQVDWQTYREHFQAAESCTACEDWPQALRYHCQAIHVLASCLRLDRRVLFERGRTRLFVDGVHSGRGHGAREQHIRLATFLVRLIWHSRLQRWPRRRNGCSAIQSR